MIPRHLLSHTVTLKSEAGKDRDRNPTFIKTILRNVRVTATTQTINGQIGAEKSDTMTLYIDAKNTFFYDGENEQEEEKTIPKEGDSVEWENKNFTVSSVTPCFAESPTPHHWEIGLK